jgi:hypothetical protein
VSHRFEGERDPTPAEIGSSVFGGIYRHVCLTTLLPTTSNYNSQFTDDSKIQSHEKGSAGFHIIFSVHSDVKSQIKNPTIALCFNIIDM